MNMMEKTFTAFLIGISASGKAHAYLDPGTGSIVLQGIIAGIAVAWFTIKTYWYKLAALFGKKVSESLLEDDTDNDADPT